MLNVVWQIGICPEYMDPDIVEYPVGKTSTQEQRVRVLTEIDLYLKKEV